MWLNPEVKEVLRYCNINIVSHAFKCLPEHTKRNRLNLTPMPTVSNYNIPFSYITVTNCCQRVRFWLIGVGYVLKSKLYLWWSAEVQKVKVLIMQKRIFQNIEYHIIG